MVKSSKLYDKSPSIKKDDKGKPGISKPKKADAEDMGIEGNPIEGAGDGMPVDINEDERLSMHKRHQEEQSSMHERHAKDLKEMHKRHVESKKAEKAKEVTEGDASKEKKE